MFIRFKLCIRMKALKSVQEQKTRKKDRTYASGKAPYDKA